MTPQSPTPGQDRADQIAETLQGNPVPTRRLAETLEPAAQAATPQPAGLDETLMPSTIGSTGQPGVPPSAAHTDTETIPGFELLGELGQGGMGVVYRARDSLRRTVALKMIRSGAAAGSSERKRFRDEAEAVARLQHPHIVQVFAFGEHRGEPYFSLEFCSGGSLEKRLRDKPLTADEAAPLVQTLALAVHHAHQQRVIHRDLKPANVLLAEDGTPKITDFGLAKNLDEVGQTQSGAVMGTPSYMSPEQAAGKIDAIGPVSDVWALGAILYECLTGQPPFRAANVMDTLMQVMNEEPLPPTRLASKTPHNLETICLKCLQKDPARRYLSAEELAEDLRRFRAGEPIRARPVGQTERLWRWCRRNPLVASLTFLVFFTLTAGVIVSLLLWFQAEQNADNERFAKGVAQKFQKEAEEREKGEKREKEKVQLALAGSEVARAHQLWQSGKLATAAALLDSTPQEMRTWEHAYLTGLIHNPEQTLRGHTDGVRGVYFSPDGKTIASASTDNTIRLWDAASGLEAMQLSNNRASGFSRVAFSPDGKRLAFCSLDQVKICEAKSGKLLTEWKASENWIRVVSFSSDGARLLTADERAIRVWDAANTQLLLTIPGYGSAEAGACFSPDGTRIVGGTGQVVKVWDAQTGQELLAIPNQNLRAARVAYSPDGTRVAVGTVDGTVGVWNARSGRQVFSFQGHVGQVWEICFSPDGRRLASVGADRFVKVWDAFNGEEQFTFKGHTDRVYCVAFRPDGRCLVTGDGNGAVKLWDVASGQESLTLRGHDKVVYGACFSPDGRRVASAGEDGTARVWDLQTGLETLSFREHGKEVIAVRFSPDGKLVATLGRDSKARVWEAHTGKQIAVFDKHKHWLEGIHFSPDGEHIATAGTDNMIRVWKAATGEEVYSQAGHTGAVRSVAYSPNGDRLVSGGDDGTVRIWDVKTRQQQRQMGMQTNGILAVCFSPDGKQVVSGGYDHLVRVWNADTGEQIMQCKGHADPVGCVAFRLPDGQRILSGGGDGVIRVWSSRSGQEILALQGHAGSVNSINSSTDGRRIVSSGGDGLVRVWSVQDDDRVMTAPGHYQGTKCLAFSPDGKRLVSGGIDHIARVWDVNTGKELLAFKDHRLSVNAIGFSPDGRWVCSGGSDNVAKIWDAATGQVQVTFAGHNDALRELQFSADGKQVVSLANSGHPLSWDALSGAPMPMPAQLAPSLQHRSADGKLLAMADKSSIHVFRMGPDDNRAASLRRLSHSDPAWHAEGYRRETSVGYWFGAGFHLERLLRLKPNPQELPELLMLQLGSLRFDEARQTWLQIVADAANDPQNAWLPVYWGQIIPHDEKTMPKMLELARALVAKNRMGSHLDWLGRALYQARQYDEAVKVLEEAARVQGHGGYLETQMCLALTRHRQGRQEEARTLYRRFEEAAAKWQPKTWQERLRWQLITAEAKWLFSTMPRADDR